MASQNNPIDPTGAKATGDTSSAGTKPKAFDEQGAVGHQFTEQGAIGGTAQKVGGPLSSEGMIGKQFTTEGAIGGNVQEAMGGQKKK
ncbi:hypothetical protein SODALDRAFT_326564 [Sodiomyces alkalinus F11]|uniref:Uncharacterized protein n=1 Tax=Sodiomyces alkalinus (strain CBS 110278 / VKM F-3762 / F11) TaxID=1314773 RepID=A0A3N2Q6N3_SODAK|nr:hypothetical protein SODALDRAFT_326564 [Sodiomyces alkalinus F11]ROT42400.1 hypothetical protein SODALDRAFT_326564 [Sodiomyces alkalinus F11]